MKEKGDRQRMGNTILCHRIPVFHQLFTYFLLPKSSTLFLSSKEANQNPLSSFILLKGQDSGHCVMIYFRNR